MKPQDEIKQLHNDLRNLQNQIEKITSELFELNQITKIESENLEPKLDGLKIKQLHNDLCDLRVQVEKTTDVLFNLNDSLIIETENLEPKFDTPEIGQSYWFLRDDGSREANEWQNDQIDTERLKYGNVFLIEKDCQKQFIYTQLRAKYVAYVKEYNGDWAADWSDKKQEKNHLEWDYDYEAFFIHDNYTNNGTDIDFQFKDYNFLPFIQKRMTDNEIRAVINHDLSMIEVEHG